MLHTAVIPDEETFKDFENGKEVLVSVIIDREIENEYKSGNNVQVYLKSTSEGKGYIANIVKNNGYQKGRPEEVKSISILVKKVNIEII